MQPSPFQKFYDADSNGVCRIFLKHQVSEEKNIKVEKSVRNEPLQKIQSKLI